MIDIQDILNKYKRPRAVLPSKWRVSWTFYNLGEVESHSSLDFMIGSKADKFIQELRKRAVKKNRGVVVEKVNLRKGKITKRYKKGYRRSW